MDILNSISEPLEVVIGSSIQVSWDFCRESVVRGISAPGQKSKLFQLQNVAVPVCIIIRYKPNRPTTIFWTYKGSAISHWGLNPPLPTNIAREFSTPSPGG